MPKLCAGIEIAADSVRLVLFDGTEILKTVCKRLPEELEGAASVASDALGRFVRSVAEDENVGCRRCALVIPRTACFTRRFSLPVIPQRSVKINLEYEFRNFAVGADEYLYDYAVLGKSAGQGGTELMDLHAAAVRRSYIDDFRKMFGAAGFRLKVAVPHEFAYANLLRRLGGEKKLRCIVDIGWDSARVMIYSGARFEVSRLIEYPAGGLDNSDEILRRVAFDTSMTISYFVEAHGGELDTVDAMYVCGDRSCVERIAAEMEQTLDSAKSGIAVRSAVELMPPCRGGGEFAAQCAAALGAAVQA